MEASSELDWRAIRSVNLAALSSPAPGSAHVLALRNAARAVIYGACPPAPAESLRSHPLGLSGSLSTSLAPEAMDNAGHSSALQPRSRLDDGPTSHAPQEASEDGHGSAEMRQLCAVAQAALQLAEHARRTRRGLLCELLESVQLGNQRLAAIQRVCWSSPGLYLCGQLAAGVEQATMQS